MKRKRASTLELLGERQTHARRPQGPLQRYAEDKAAHFELEEMVCRLPVSVRSTFLMVFSPNGAQVASTHGDHKIYVCQVSTGRLLNTLEGHPRTPWCLAFHPTCNDLLASGCLGGEVRVWDLRGGGSEVWVCPEKSVITSLSFHPMENFIALSTVNRVHFWDWSQPEPFAMTKTSSEREKVRLVRFSPQGDYLLTGITNMSALSDRVYRQHRRSTILSRLMTMYHRLGEMLPPSPSSRFQSLLQRRIARRGGTRRVTHDDLLELLRLRYNDRQSYLFQRFRDVNRNSWSSSTGPEAEAPGSGSNLPPYEPPIHSWTVLLELARQHAASRDASTMASQPPSSAAHPSDQPSSAGQPSSSDSSAGPSRSAPSHLGATGFTSSNSGASTAFNNAASSESASNMAGSSSSSGPMPNPCTRPHSSNSATAGNSSNPSGSSYSSSASQTDGPSVTDPMNAQRGDNAELWVTFNRLRALCTRLENRMLRHSDNNNQPPPSPFLMTSGYSGPREPSPLAQPTPSSSSRTSSPPSRELPSQSLPSTSSASHPMSEDDNAFRSSDPPGSPPSSRADESQSDISLSLVSLLSRLQESLQSLSEATTLSGVNRDGAAARRQIREVRLRISEILERLENVSGYRERLRGLREQIYQAAERMARRNEEDDHLGGPPSSSQQWDLAYCLWLVEMSLQLTNQMQRILTADYRLSRLHLSRGRSSEGRSTRPRLDDAAAALIAATAAAAAATDPILPGSDAATAAAAANAGGPGQPANPNNLLLFGSSESESESDGDGEGRPPGTIPPFTTPPFRAPQYNLARHAPAGIGALNAVTHRIQYWKTTGDEMIPQISDARARLVVNICKITNDGSVDVSPCGRLLVALVPDAVGVTLSVFSLEEASMGQVLYTWGFGPNAVSVSFSPLSRYIVVGLASSRYISPQREVVAQIFRLGARPVQGQTGSVLLEHVGNMSQPLVGSNASHQLSSLNCVRWLPNPGEGLVYGTNRGTLCICRPLCSVCQECSGEAQGLSQHSREGGEHRDGGLRHTRRDSFQNLTAYVEETAMRQVLRRP